MSLIMQAGQFIVGVAIFFYGVCFITWLLTAFCATLIFLGKELVEYLYKLLHPETVSAK